MKRQNRGKKQKANKLSGDTSAWTTFEGQYLLLLFFKEKNVFSDSAKHERSDCRDVVRYSWVSCHTMIP